MVKNPPANAGNTRHESSIHELEKSPGVGNGNLLQYSLPGSSPGGSREFEAGTALARIRKQLLN